MTPIGRFAPSPTGPLHMGSLLTALASFFDIKQQGGHWFVRIDDLDPPRQDPSAISAIKDSLLAHGLVGDQDIDFQSQHSTRYETALQQIAADLFNCDCTRRELAAFALYPGTCRTKQSPQQHSATRLRVGGETCTFDDRIQSTIEFTPGVDFGDLIVRRRDGLWAYNFATAIDDGTDVTHVLRGADLLQVTPLQVFIIQKLQLQQPTYAHLPILCYADGTKLSKQTHAPPLNNKTAATNLRTALHYLGLEPPDQPDWGITQWLGWGLEHWSLQHLPSTLKPFVEA